MEQRYERDDQKIDWLESENARLLAEMKRWKEMHTVASDKERLALLQNDQMRKSLEQIAALEPDDDGEKIKFARVFDLATSIADKALHPETYGAQQTEKPKHEACICGQVNWNADCKAHTEKRKCEHETVPTFDGLGVRLKCQLCNEYVSE